MEYKYDYISKNDEFYLNICCITYNLHGDSLNFSQICQLLTVHKNQSCDIYAIATQESQRSILMNLFFWDKTKFEEDLARFFGKDYVRLKTETLGGIHLIIFIKKIHKNYILNYYKEYIKTGFYGLLGNKGAVGIGFTLYDISFFIISCHLCTGFNNNLYRNYDFDHIKKNIHPYLYKYDVIIWMGDFNYRINKSKEEVEEILRNKNELNLFESDQMTYEIKHHNLKCAGFKEGKVDFMPTYKYSEEEDTNELLFDSLDHIPSWTDRILFRINDSKFFYIKEEENEDNKYENHSIEINEDKINMSFQLVHYNSMQNIVFSDHKPVFAYFNITIN